MLKEATTDERTSLLHQTNTSDDDDVSDDVTTVSSSCCGRFKDPASVGQRLLVLLLMCFLSFGEDLLLFNVTVGLKIKRSVCEVTKSTFDCLVY